MTDLSLFASKIVQTGTGSGVLSGNGLLGGASGLGGNADFFAALLNGIGSEEELIDTNKKINENGLTKDEVKQNKESDIALLQLALLGQDPDQSLEEKLSELKIENLELAKTNRVDTLQKMIEHLTRGLPSDAPEELNGQIENLVSRLSKKLDSLQSSIDAFRSGEFGDQGAPLDILIATGMNPAELTRISQRIEEVEAKLGRPLTVEDLIAGVGNIVPAPGDDDHEFAKTDALKIMLGQNKTDEEIYAEEKAAEKEALKKHHEEEFTGDLYAETVAAQLNNVVLSGNIAARNKVVAASLAAGNVPSSNATSALNAANTANSGIIETPAEDLPQALSNAEFKALFGGKSSANTNFGSMAKINVGNFAANNSMPMLPQTGDLALPPSFTQAMSSTDALSEALGFDVQTGTPFSATMQAAHAVTASNVSAGQAAPATQMVSAQINKAANSGNTNNIILQLDPPELGRVEVRLEFGAERAVKAHLVVEKPETLLMLQRDANALDKALQDAGLETGSDSLNYEMAAEDHAFNQDGKHENGQTGTENAKDNGEIEEEIIETTMTWDVDPDTGHVHYSILA
jgi:flagellar hook-length control protein FliK